jgi:hypothetical protein
METEANIFLGNTGATFQTRGIITKMTKLLMFSAVKADVTMFENWPMSTVFEP